MKITPYLFFFFLLWKLCPLFHLNLLKDQTTFCMYMTMKPLGWSSGRQVPSFRDEPPSSTTRVSGVQGSVPLSCTVKKAFSSFSPHQVLKWESMMIQKNSNISVALVLKVNFACTISRDKHSFSACLQSTFFLVFHQQ